MREIVNISEYSKKMRNYYDSEGKLIPDRFLSVRFFKTLLKISCYIS